MPFTGHEEKASLGHPAQMVESLRVGFLTSFQTKGYLEFLLFG